MKISTTLLMVLILTIPKPLLAQNSGTAPPIHKYWTCAISSYDSWVNGKHQTARCQANTEYSAPPCRGFVVEYEGEKGIRPNVAYIENTTMESLDGIIKTMLPTVIRIEINPVGDQYLYRHTIEQTNGATTNQWVYNGFCQYNEAPAHEKIHMDHGLNIGR